MPYSTRRPFADPDKKDPGLLSDMAKLGEAGVARVEAREKALQEASERRKATRDALSQAQVVENKMMARVLRGSSQDVQLLVRHPGLWERWLGKLRKRGFFDGVDEGSPEFDERVRKAPAGLRAEPGRAGVRLCDARASESAPRPPRPGLVTTPASAGPARHVVWRPRATCRDVHATAEVGERHADEVTTNRCPDLRERTSMINRASATLWWCNRTSVRTSASRAREVN